MTLLVHVWVRDDEQAGGSRILDAPEGVSELAGFERTRRLLWGSETVRNLGATFFPQLDGSDLWVLPEEVEAFVAECALLAAELPRLAEASGLDEDYIGTRLGFIAAAAERARGVGGGVVVW